MNLSVVSAYTVSTQSLPRFSGPLLAPATWAAVASLSFVSDLPRPL